MNTALLMAIDLGTSFVKTGVYTTKGECIACEKEPVKAQIPRSGVFIQHGEDLFGSVLYCIENVTAQLREKARDIEAIAFTGQMAGFMGVDANWSDITTWSCSLDSRYVPWAEKQFASCKREFLEIGGTNSPMMAPKIAWFTEAFPEEAAKVAKFVMISGYIMGRLGDIPIEEASIDGTYVTWTGLGDINRNVWSEETCRKLNIPMEKLPKIVKSNHICGRLSSSIAKLTGMREGIPLVSGAGDKITSCVGANILREGELVFDTSSYAGVTCMVNSFKPNFDKSYYDGIPSAVGEGIYAIHYTPGSGISLDWFMKNFTSGDTFHVIDERVDHIPIGCDGLMAIGLLGGSNMPFNADLRGMWLGFDWSHTNAHFYRALLESYCFDFSITVDSIREQYPQYPYKTARVIGGGAQSRVWTQMIADVCGIELHKIDRDDLALWAAAMLAGNAVGLFENIGETAENAIAVAEVFKPNMEKHAAYAAYKDFYLKTLREMSPICRERQQLGQ